MKRIFRLVLVPAILTTLFIFAPVRPAAADTCRVASGTLPSGGSITVTAPAGHTYRFDYTGGASGSITIIGILTIVNGTGSSLNYTIWDLNGSCAGGAAVTFFNPGDGRLNVDPVAPAVVYPATAGFPIYAVGPDSKGTLSLAVTCADIAKISSNPAVNMLIKQTADGRIRLYRLTTGEFQINVRQSSGLDYVYTWQGSQCSPTTSASGTQNSVGNAAGSPCSQSYVVQPGDNLFRIALAHGTTTAILARLNGITDPSQIYIGQVLKIPLATCSS